MITVVTGPPCSGKSTHVTEHSKPGDIIIDLDRIALALSHHDTEHHQYPMHVRVVAIAARAAAISAALNLEAEADVWLIHTKPGQSDSLKYKRMGAQRVRLDPGYETCMRRAAEHRPEWVRQMISDWYASTPKVTRGGNDR